MVQNLRPEFVARIGVDFLGRRLDFSSAGASNDPSIATRVLNVQKAVLDVVMADTCHRKAILHHMLVRGSYKRLRQPNFRFHRK